MIGRSGAREFEAMGSQLLRLAPVKALLTCAVILVLTPSAGHAKFRGKGSVVGRLLSESVAEAASPKAKREASADDDSEMGEGSDDVESNENEKPISRDALNALMKHPTEPVYDPLRQMSGKWVRCIPNPEVQKQAADSVPASVSPPLFIQDRFSSTDRTHFTRTITGAGDRECKTLLNAERSMYECTSADKKAMFCKLTRRETRTGSSVWTPTKLTGQEKSVKLSFPGQHSKRSKKKKARDPRRLEVRLDDETFTLDFEQTPAPANSPRKTND